MEMKELIELRTFVARTYADAGRLLGYLDDELVAKDPEYFNRKSQSPADIVKSGLPPPPEAIVEHPGDCGKFEPNHGVFVPPGA